MNATIKTNVSFFTSASKPYVVVPTAPPNKKYIHYATGHYSFIEIIRRIQACFYEDLIDSIKQDYKNLKYKTLPAFTPSGTFRLRLDSDLMQYSQIIHLDYDNIFSVHNLKNEAKKLPTTHAVFTSPSQNGIKVFVKVNTSADDHLKAYQVVKQYYDDALGVPSDPKCKNISRLCFISYDRDLYYNHESGIFDCRSAINKNEDTRTSSKIKPLQNNVVYKVNTDNNLIFKYLYDFTTRKAGHYQKDNRNNFLFLFACNCNRYGISLETAKDLTQSIWYQGDTAEMTLDEVLKTIQSAYSNTQEHAKFKLPRL